MIPRFFRIVLVSPFLFWQGLRSSGEKTPITAQEPPFHNPLYSQWAYEYNT